MASPTKSSKLSNFFSLFTRKSFSEFNRNPFKFVDNLSLDVKGYELNLLRDDKGLRKSVLIFAFLSGFIWLIAGWDSSASQVELFVEGFVKQLFLDRKLDWGKLVEIYNNDYGKGIHWSAFIIYGLLFYGLSRFYWKKYNIRNSLNVTIAFGFTLFSVAIFEYFWHWSFRWFQSQAWVLEWGWPQFRVLFQTRIWLFASLFMIIILHLKHGKHYRFINWRNTQYYLNIQTNMPQFRLNFNIMTYVLIGLTFTSVYVWWFYGDFFPVEQITVEVIGGPDWTNNIYFPQTVYTIETDLTDNLNAGDQFFVENNLLHGINTLVKIFFTLTIYNIGRIRKISDYIEVAN